MAYFIFIQLQLVWSCLLWDGSHIIIRIRAFVPWHLGSMLGHCIQYTLPCHWNNKLGHPLVSLAGIKSIAVSISWKGCNRALLYTSQVGNRHKTEVKTKRYIWMNEYLNEYIYVSSQGQQANSGLWDSAQLHFKIRTSSFSSSAGNWTWVHR